MTQLPVQTYFDGNPLDLITIGNRQWLRGAQIALSLGYANPKQAIKDLIARNKAEFDMDDMMVVQMQSTGGSQLTRIFSDTGCVKLGMLAKTPKAAAFRNWAAKTLTTPPAPPVLELHGGMGKTAQSELREFWLRHRPNRKFLKYANMPLSNSEIAKLCDWKTAGTVTRKRRAAEVLGLIAPNTRQVPSSFQRHVALQRAASASLALSSHAG